MLKPSSNEKRTACKILLGLILAVGFSWAQPASVPSTQTPAEILWDSWGVPHIYAPTDTSLFKAFGWAQMRTHGKLLLHLYALARGRGAEFYGPDDLASDRSVRLMGLYSIAQKWYAQQTPEFRADLDAFAEGINLYAKDHRQELDPGALKVLPVDGVDVVAHGIRWIWRFMADHANIRSSLPSDDLPGSNGWAIGPSHSADGHAMLLANPHVPWDGDRMFLEAQLSGPDYQAYGATCPGFPVLLIAFNETLGWTNTSNTINPCTLYALIPDGQGYRFEGRHRAFAQRIEKIKILQSGGTFKTEDFKVRASLQGPVFENQGKLFALRNVGLQCGSFAGGLEESWKMGQAHNLKEFQAALRMMQHPFGNVIYADAEGNIFLFDGGLVPKKGGGDTGFWSRPVPGDTASALWTDYWDYDSLPHALDPPSGWVQNSNSAPWFMTLPFLDWRRYSEDMADPTAFPSFREQRGLRMLTESSKISFDQMVADKFSTRSELADRVVGDLVKAARARGGETLRAAADVLSAWDRQTEANSRGAVLFEAWANKAFASEWPLSVPFDPGHFLETPRGFAYPGREAQFLEDAAKEVVTKYGRMDVAWGEVHRYKLGNFDFPGNEGSPSLGIFRSVWYWKPAGPNRTAAAGGDSFIAAVEFSKPLKAQVLLPYGNTSDPDSPHYGDQLELDAQKKLRPAWFYRKDVEAHTVERSLIPADGIRVEKP